MVFNGAKWKGGNATDPTPLHKKKGNTALFGMLPNLDKNLSLI
jgi:hypothetical protein